jgi:hypothetical protein
MVGIADLFSIVSADWGWVLTFIYGSYEVYWPMWTTKFQNFSSDLSTRLRNIEVVQVSMAQEVEGMSGDEVSELHEQDKLSPNDLKNQPPVDD